MLSAFDIRTNVICDLCLQKFPGGLPGRSQLPSLCFPWAVCKISKNHREGDECLTTESLDKFADLKEEPSVNLLRGSDAPCLESAWTPWHASPFGSRRGQACFGNCFRGPLLEDKRKKASFDERTGRTWPYAHLREPIHVREAVLAVFCG